MGWLASISRWLEGADRAPPPLDLGAFEPVEREAPAPASASARNGVARVAPDRRRIAGAFDAAHPVRTRAELFGRDAELDQLLAAVLDFNKHAVLYGGRGSGKTSLARVLGDHADGLGAVVLYYACEPQADFAQLLSPYLESLPATALVPGARREFAEALQRLPAKFSPRALVDLLAGRVVNPTVLIFDEFDRIEDPAVQADVAAAMKLLSDTLTPVTFVLVGIARTVSDVITGHPSLRRHMQTVALRRIADRAVGALIDAGEVESGVHFAPEARAMIVDAACGSPYHLRLLAGKAALAALASGKQTVQLRHACAGFVDAYAEWTLTNELDARLFAAAIARSTTMERAVLEEVARGIAAHDLVQVKDEFGEALSAIEPALAREPGPYGSVLVSFRDSTAPQMFLALLMTKQSQIYPTSTNLPQEGISAEYS